MHSERRSAVSAFLTAASLMFQPVLASAQSHSSDTAMHLSFQSTSAARAGDCDGAKDKMAVATAAIDSQHVESPKREAWIGRMQDALRACNRKNP